MKSTLYIASLVGLYLTVSHAAQDLQRMDPGPTAADEVSRIAGGDVVKGRSFPFMSMLTIVMDESSFLCGASLLSKDYLITAAHCVTNNGIPVSARSVTVGVGSNDAQDLRSYKVNRIHVHPDYDYENVVNDLALIRLRRPLDFDSGPEKIGTVAIAKEDLRDNEVFTAIGWGKTSSTGDISSSLREVNVTTGPSDACKAANPEFDGEDGRQICTAKNKNHDTCQGDSGGPLLLPVGPKDYQLAGITSYGYAPSDPNIICGTDSVVAYYTHVKYYIKWISEVTGESKEELYKKRKDDDLDKDADSTDTVSDTDLLTATDTPTATQGGDEEGPFGISNQLPSALSAASSQTTRGLIGNALTGLPLAVALFLTRN